MVSLAALWLPIVLSAVLVFVVSAAIWMAMPHHKKDFSKVENEDAVMDALRPNVSPGMYYFPFAMGAEANEEEYKAKVRKGPVGILKVREPEGVLTIEAPPSRYVSSLEVVDLEGRQAWRARQGVVQLPLVPGLVDVSDLMILEEGAPLPETMEENRAARVDENGELRLGEALEEKLALSDRFGLVLGFLGFDQDTYLAIVRHYVDRAGLDVEELGWESVREDALRWALERASRSGRIARQFVDDLAGRTALDAKSD